MAYLGGIIRTLKNGMASMNEANILRVMRQKDGSIGVGDERVLVGQEMLGGKEVSVSGKMKILLLKIADGTVAPGYVRKNMDLLREINSDKQNLSKAVTDNIMAMKSCDDVVSALLGKKVQGLVTEIPSVSDEERKSKDGLEHFYERVRDACRKVFKKDGYRVLLDKLDACNYIEKIYDHNHVVIAKVTSHEGAVGVGAFGASWCTCVAGANSDNRYDHYKGYDMRIVFVDRGDDRKSIWQLSESKGSWCMNADNNSDEGNMFATIVEASGGDNTLCDIVDAIDNDILSKWLDKEFDISEKGIKTDLEYDRKDVGGCCIVTRKRMVNGYSLAEMYNFCKAGFGEISEAEFLLSEWADRIEDPKDGFIKVAKRGKQNLFDMKTKKLVLPEWVGSVGHLKDGFVSITKEGERNLFDLKKNEFVLPEWFGSVEYLENGFISIGKREAEDWEFTILDLKTMKSVLPELVDTIYGPKDGFVEVGKHGKWNMFDLKTKELVIPEWVDYVKHRYEDNFVVEVKKDWKYNLFDLGTKKFLFSEWLDYVDDPEDGPIDGFASVGKDGKQNLFDFRTKNLVLPEWIEHVDYPENGFAKVKKDGKQNFFDLNTKEFALQEWFNYVDRPKDGFVKVEKDGKYNMLDMKTNALVLPEWADEIHYPKDGFVRVEKEGKENLVDLKTNAFVLPEWVDRIYFLGYEFIGIEKDGEHQKINLSDLRKTESRRRRRENRICECCGRRIR